MRLKNVDLYKKDTTSEIFGALGLFSKLDLYKNVNNTKSFSQTKNVNKVCTW